MGLIPGRIGTALFILFIPGLLLAAPQLRLSQNSVGPISVAAGAAGPATSVDAYNVGDGRLNLKVSSSVPWLTATVGTPGNCVFQQGACTPIRMALQTSSLARGRYTGMITVSDPAAVDSPQNITVVVQVGGGVPDRIDFNAPPTSSKTDFVFSNSSPLNVALSTQSGGEWLAVLNEGGNPFRPGTTYRAVASVLPGMSEGTYNGSIVTSGSPIASENKTIAVTLRVTSQPVAQLSADRANFHIAQGSAKQTSYVMVSNRGLGSLDVSGVTATAASAGNWLTLERPQPGLLAITANPAGLGPGGYEGSIAIASNAAQGAISLPVHLEIVPATAPVAAFQGVVNNATFEAGDFLSRGSIVAVFGEQFTTGEAKQASSLPLQNEMAGTRVFVNNQPAPIYYLSYNQINFQIPYDAAVGDGVVRVDRDGQRGNDVSVRIVRGAPRLLRLGIGNYGIIVNQDGSFPIPATPGVASHPAHAGDTLVIYAIGLGPTVPAVASGAAAPSSPLAQTASNYRVTFGDGGPFRSDLAIATPLFAGLTPNFVGLYQINVTIPSNAPKGAAVPLILTTDQDGASNAVTIAIE